MIIRFLIRRVMGMIPTLIVISVLVFVLIQLPPGDAITSQLELLQQQGREVSQAQIDAMRRMFYLDQPLHRQYLYWIGNFIKGDMGYSVTFNKPVNSLIWDRIGYTVVIAASCIMFTWATALPIGIFSAVRQYSWGDYFSTVLGLLGIAIPSFMLALILMYLGHQWFGVSVGGLFSPEMEAEPWSTVKLIDFLKHLWVPVIVVGASGTAGTMRILRANLLDELKKPYVITARAKGVPPVRLIFKYPVRIAINPFISMIGWLLPTLFSGSIIVSIVLSLPTTGPLLLRSLMAQDMHLAGSFLMILSTLTVIGTLISDILLVVVDPRIKFE